MNEQFLKFIELCLTDSIISDKEREVIFRKAKELNIDTDECEIILESMIQQKNIELPNKNINEYDSLFNEAIDLVLKHKEFSIDFLKIKLKLGSNRALRIYDQLIDSNKIPKQILKKISGNEKNIECIDSKLENRPDIVKKKLQSLNVNSLFIEEFIKNEYKKLWKVNCFISEPFYSCLSSQNNKLISWRNSNNSFFIPSVGIISEKGAIAFIKSNWIEIYKFSEDKYWKKSGGDGYSVKAIDKTKIEIIEIFEIEL